MLQHVSWKSLNFLRFFGCDNFRKQVFIQKCLRTWFNIFDSVSIFLKFYCIVWDWSQAEKLIFWFFSLWLKDMKLDWPIKNILSPNWRKTFLHTPWAFLNFFRFFGLGGSELQVQSWLITDFSQKNSFFDLKLLKIGAYLKKKRRKPSFF